MRRINWEQLYLKNATQLKGICRRYVGDTMVAEDLVQETFITAIDKVHTFKGIGSIEGWIRKIAINKTLLYLREKQLEHLPLESMTFQILQEAEMEKSTNKIRETIDHAIFTRNELLTVIDRLPQHHKAVFNLYVIDGYTHKQIAEMLQISIGTSKSCLSRARKKAQELLYVEALQVQTRMEPRRRNLIFLFCFRPNSIDQIFRKGLRGLELSVASPATSIISASTATVKWGIALTAKSVAVGFLVAAPPAGFVLYQINQTPIAESPVIQVIDSIAHFDSMVLQKLDSVQVKGDTVIPTERDEPTNASTNTNNQPIVVKKTIVVHDTIRIEAPATK